MNTSPEERAAPVIPPTVAEALSRYGTIREFPRGTTLFQAGEPGDTMFLIEKGWVHVRLENRDDIIRLGPGAALGELALLLPEHRRTGEAVAQTSVRLRVLGRDEFAALSHEEPRVAIDLVQGIATYLLESEQRLVSKLRQRTVELELTLQHLRRTREDLDAAEIRAMTDPLTGLYNRRAFEHHLSLIEGGSRREAPQVVLLLLDLDRFKEINDHHGHPAGDQVLRTVARMLERATRSTDLPFRIGGDELAVLAMGANAEEGELLARRILTDITAEPVLFGADRIPVSVSIGGTIFLPGEPYSQALKRADQALYEAKEMGRGCQRWVMV